jgi:hypothetical protein
MGLGDLGNAIIIVFIFSLLHILLSLSIGISNIKNNWQKYKCKPGIMPIANIFGHDVKQNFDECVKITQTGFMKSFMDPLYTSIGFFAQNGAIFTQIFENLKLFGNKQNSGMGNFVNTIKGRLAAFGEETGNIYINIVDSFSKLGATITILYYILESGIILGEETWNSLPGTLMSFGLSVL